MQYAGFLELGWLQTEASGNRSILRGELGAFGEGAAAMDARGCRGSLITSES